MPSSSPPDPTDSSNNATDSSLLQLENDQSPTPTQPQVSSAPKVVFDPTKKLPKFVPLERPNKLLERISGFLPQMAKANAQLEGRDQQELDIEAIDETEPHIQMDIGLLGVRRDTTDSSDCSDSENDGSGSSTNADSGSEAGNEKIDVRTGSPRPLLVQVISEDAVASSSASSGTTSDSSK